ncbi:MAG: glycerophosphoryl diester phosphodiesterase [Psychromonas sp.]|jgi:glycerophosphoryl diester phosphodiesterase|uniref:glycerophosphoryl diester phosphodiesterase n=1 Tax=Psychromonas sp. TaxID=1884585 RepID=UPI0039E60307
MITRIAAHRGGASLAPENTLAGIHKAAELDLSWIEIDTQLSADGVPVIIHDKTVDRCSNGNGAVADLHWSELQQLDAGSWFDQAFADEKFPSLSQVLTICQPLTIQINLELKIHNGDDINKLCEQVTRVIEQSGFPHQRLLISSFNHQAMQQIKQQLPDIRRGQLWETISDDWQEQLQAIDAYSAHCHYRFLTKQQANQVKQAGYQLICYTANNPDEVREHWHWGVDLMITDTPQRYLEMP